MNPDNLPPSDKLRKLAKELIELWMNRPPLPPGSPARKTEFTLDNDLNIIGMTVSQPVQHRVITIRDDCNRVICIRDVFDEPDSAACSDQPHDP